MIAIKTQSTTTDELFKNEKKILKGENKGEILKDKIIPKSVYDNNRIHLESQSQSMDFEYILNKEATLKHLTK